MYGDFLSEQLLKLSFCLQGVAFPYRASPPSLDAVDISFVTDIYFHQKNEREHQAALELRDAVLRLRKDGAFVAVPLWRVNLEPIGPHPVGESPNFAPSGGPWLTSTRDSDKDPTRSGVRQNRSHPYFLTCA
jgi:hypothetical protein